MNDLLLNIIGYSASLCMVLGYLPQAISTIRTRQTDGIALPTFIMLDNEVRNATIALADLFDSFTAFTDQRNAKALAVARL